MKMLDLEVSIDFMLLQIFHADILLLLLLLLMVLLLTCGQILGICALITRHSVLDETTETMVIQINDDLLFLHAYFTFYFSSISIR